MTRTTTSIVLTLAVVLILGCCQGGTCVTDRPAASTNDAGAPASPQR